MELMATRWTAIVSRNMSGAHSKAFVMKAVGSEGARQKHTAIRADDAGVGILPRPQIGIKMLQFGRGVLLFLTVLVGKGVVGARGVVLYWPPHLRRDHTRVHFASEGALRCIDGRCLPPCPNMWRAYPDRHPFSVALTVHG